MQAKTRSPVSALAMSDSMKYRAAHVLLVFLAVCFALQVFSPLRLNNDAIVLLSMGESAAHGNGFLYDGQKPVFPPGYPALLAVLLRVGLAHPWVIVSLNMAFLSMGLFAAHSVLVHEFFEDRTLALAACSFFLLSYVVIKHSTLPLTDAPFFGLAMSSIALMSRAERMQSGRGLGSVIVGAMLLAAAAMGVRTVGAALFPPLVLIIAARGQFMEWLKGLSFRGRVAVVGGAVFVGGAAAVMLVATPYWQFFIGGKKGWVGSLLLQTLVYRVSELGELFGNFPFSKLPIKLHVLVPLMGVILLLLLIRGFGTRKVRPTDTFVVCYVGVLLLWPYYDARYWLPVIPFLIGYTILAVRSLRLPGLVVAVYCFGYAALGFAVIAYSTRITFAGCAFPDRYGDGNLRATYRAALPSCGACVEPDRVDAKVVHLLREYR